MTVTTPETDAELALRLATQAGRGLLVVREQLVDGGAHPWQVMDGGDTASQRFLADELARLRPDDAVLSEEGLEDPRRFIVDRVWIIDPLDGHAGVRRAGAVGLGGARRPLGGRRASPPAPSASRRSASRSPPNRRRSCHRRTASGRAS